jgi:hypothetical protein
LKDFDERTKGSNIVPRIRKHLLKMARYVTRNLTLDINLLYYRKHAKVDESGIKFKPAELSQEDIEAAKNLQEGVGDNYSL